MANSWIRTPRESWITLVVVGSGLDEADKWIVDHIEPGDIVITADIPLVSLCIKAHAHVISPKGKIFNEDNIGQILATRDLLTDLRSAGNITSGPPPFTKKHRSLFLQHFDQLIQAIRKKN